MNARSNKQRPRRGRQPGQPAPAQRQVPPANDGPGPSVGKAGKLLLTATCSRGLEEVLTAEVEALGATRVRPGRGMVELQGDLRTLYRANLELRTAMRVILRLAHGSAQSRSSTYELATSVAWEQHLRPGQTIAVEAVGRSERIRNLAFAAQVVKDAVVDRLRRQWGRRPDVNRSRPDLRIHLHIADDEAHLGIDTSGEPLSHRGYRSGSGPAPLAESLAAGMLLLAGYHGDQGLLDPMCGSGTLAIEAAMLASRTPPGMRRRFAFEGWTHHDASLWKAVQQEAAAGIRPPTHEIVAADRDRRAVAAARRGLAAAGVEPWARVEHRPFDETGAIEPGTLIITNPPYGHRLGQVDRLRSTYRALGDMLKNHAAGSTAWLLLGEPQLAREIGLRPSRKIVLFNGPIECRLARYELFAGSLDSPRTDRVDTEPSGPACPADPR